MVNWRNIYYSMYNDLLSHESHKNRCFISILSTDIIECGFNGVVVPSKVHEYKFLLIEIIQQISSVMQISYELEIITYTHFPISYVAVGT